MEKKTRHLYFSTMHGFRLEGLGSQGFVQRKVYQ
jgi:hypothetical protein